jgi:hypothetical protein
MDALAATRFERTQRHGRPFIQFDPPKLFLVKAFTTPEKARLGLNCLFSLPLGALLFHHSTDQLETVDEQENRTCSDLLVILIFSHWIVDLR